MPSQSSCASRVPHSCAVFARVGSRLPPATAKECKPRLAFVGAAFGQWMFAGRKSPTLRTMREECGTQSVFQKHPAGVAGYDASGTIPPMVSQFANAHNKKFEFDFAGSRQHNPHYILVAVLSSFPRRKEAR